jgi:hypothetical protein
MIREYCKKFSVWGFTTTRSGFDFFVRHISIPGRAGALPSCANVCKRPKTDFLRGASGSTSHQGVFPLLLQISLKSCVSLLKNDKQEDKGNETTFEIDKLEWAWSKLKQLRT